MPVLDGRQASRAVGAPTTNTERPIHRRVHRAPRAGRGPLRGRTRSASARPVHSRVLAGMNSSRDFELVRAGPVFDAALAAMAARVSPLLKRTRSFPNVTAAQSESTRQAGPDARAGSGPQACCAHAGARQDHAGDASEHGAKAQGAEALGGPQHPPRRRKARLSASSAPALIGAGRSEANQAAASRALAGAWFSAPRRGLCTARDAALPARWALDPRTWPATATRSWSWPPTRPT